jgi:hypothetical protein
MVVWHPYIWAKEKVELPLDFGIKLGNIRRGR